MADFNTQLYDAICSGVFEDATVASLIQSRGIRKYTWTDRTNKTDSDPRDKQATHGAPILELVPTTAGHDLIDVNTGVNVEVFELSFATATKMLDLEVHPLKTACVKALFALQKSLPSLTFDDDFFNVTRVRVTSALGRLAQRVDIDSVFSDDHSGWLFAFQIEVHMAIG